MGIDIEKPQPGGLVVFVDDVGVVFILFLFFSSSSVLASGATNAICLPSGDQAKDATLRLPFGDGLRFAAIDREEVDLRFFAAIREERERVSVGRPARRVLGFLREGELADLARGNVENPDVTLAAGAFERIVNDESDAAAIGREAQVGFGAQRDSPFPVSAAFSRVRPRARLQELPSIAKTMPDTKYDSTSLHSAPPFDATPHQTRAHSASNLARWQARRAAKAPLQTFKSRRHRWHRTLKAIAQRKLHHARSRTAGLI